MNIYRGCVTYRLCVGVVNLDDGVRLEGVTAALVFCLFLGVRGVLESSSLSESES